MCLADYEDGEVITTLPQCSHNFHQECITLWLSQHTTCPMCRTSLAPQPPPAALPRPLQQQQQRVSGSAGSASQPFPGGQPRTASAPLLLEPGQGGWPRLVLQPAASRQQSADLGSTSPSSTQQQQQEPLMQRDGSGEGEWQPSAAAEPRRGGRWLLPQLSGSMRAWGSQARPLVSWKVLQPFNQQLLYTPLQTRALVSPSHAALLSSSRRAHFCMPPVLSIQNCMTPFRGVESQIGILICMHTASAWCHTQQGTCT